MERRPAQTGWRYGGDGGMVGMLGSTYNIAECWVLSCGGSCHLACEYGHWLLGPPPVTQSGQGRTMVATLCYGVRRAGRVAADAWQWQSSNGECTPTGQPLRKLMTCACVGCRDMAGQKGSDEAGWMAQTYMSHLVSTK